MKVLFYGAGVLGSLYAARFREAGHDVTVLARGKRLHDLRNYGILYEDIRGGPRHCTQVKVVDFLNPDDAYDWVIVIVRRTQLASVLPALAANRRTPNVLFMVNNAAGPDEILAELSPERVVLGFPGAGGVREDSLVRYIVVPGDIQSTTLGELDGRISPRLRDLAQAFESAGFKTAFCKNMDAWLKTHVALVSPVANAIYLADGSVRRLAHTPDGLVLMVRAVRENFRVLDRLKIPVTPFKIRLIRLLPEPLLVAILRTGFDTPDAEYAMEKHANIAREDEMAELAEELHALAQQAGSSTPCADLLREYIDPMEPSLPAESRSLRRDWRGTWIAAWVLLALAGFIGWHRHRRSEKQ